MYFRSIKDHPNWKIAEQELLKILDPDLITLINELFPAPFPVADIYTTIDEIIIFVELPGWQEKDDITLSISENDLVIRGFKKPKYILPKDARCLSQDIYWGPFKRTIALPYKIDPEGFSVKFSNGILKMHFQRISEEDGLD